MAATTTKNITLPREVAAAVVTKARDTSTIATLSPSTPMIFNDMTHVVFTKEPEAEFVGEGVEKSPSDFGFEPVKGGDSQGPGHRAALGDLDPAFRTPRLIVK